MNLPRVALDWTRLLSAFFAVTAFIGIVPGVAQAGNAYQPLAARHVTVLDDVGSADGSASEELAMGNTSPPTIPNAVQSGLVIHATFDASITGDPNAAAIESTINQAIAIYESLFADPITIEIYFRYASTEPNGTPFPEGAGAQSNFVNYDIPWSTFISSLT